MDILSDTCDFFGSGLDLNIQFLKKIGSGYWFDFHNEIFLRVIQDVTNDGGSVFFAMALYCQYVLHSSQSMVIR